MHYHTLLCVLLYTASLYNISTPLTLTYRMASLWRHLQSGVVSENGLIASKNAIDDAFHLACDEYHKNRTKVKVVELY